MQTGVSREELVMEEVKFGSSGKKLKILWAVVVLLLVMTILFIGLFATERKKANDAEEKVAIANKQKGGPGQPTKKPQPPVTTNKPPVITTKKPVMPTTPPGTLITPDSVQVAASVISRMDLKADPCKDFYQYSCGGWLERVAIPDSKSRYSTFSEVSSRNKKTIKQEINKIINKQKNSSSLAIQKAVRYYQSCLNKKSIERRYDQPLKDLIKKYDSWPVTDSNFDQSTWNWSTTFMRAHKYLAMTPVFNMYISDDLKNSSNNVIVFDQSGLGMSRESYLQNTTYHYKVKTAYRTLMKNIVTLLGANSTGLKLMDQVYEFETKLANITLPMQLARQYNKNYKKMPLRQFANQTKIPLEWLRNWLTWAFNDTKFVVTDDVEVISYSLDYIGASYQLFQAETADVQASYMMWKVVFSLGSVLLGKYKAAYNEYYEAILGTTAEDPRWETCMQSTSGTFGFALGRLFVDKAFKTSAKTMANEMISGIRKKFIDNIDTLTWMDTVTKNAAKEKARAIIENIGYPSFVVSDAKLDEYYKGLITFKDKYFENVLNRRQFYNVRNYNKIGKPVDKTEWAMTPADVNAYYSPTENKIVFPAGILQTPFYDYRAPRALNYGAIGVVVGHEITHGFDDQGKDFNKEGNSQNWWTKESEAGFKQQSKCLVDQYSKYSLYNKNLNGNQTLGENIADNGGSKAAFKAYRDWVKSNGAEKKLPGLDLTPEQLFFIGFAQVWCSKYREAAAISQIERGVHSISKFRIIGTLHNSKEFSEVYKCKKGSFMNPDTKCSVW